ncbi:MAG: diphosphate--fructose-6-phosphate 1-phosphotransferase [Spirochaetes bacterium]|nr:MAG: diphosphate--fructose-6-phosphate 1-phosphotransferase [Spirochaetota bacterium]
MNDVSLLQKLRYQYKPKLPAIFQEDIRNITIEKGEPTESVGNQTELKQMFEKTYGRPVITFTRGKNPNISLKRNVGVVLSGGQAPGGHNVIAGLFDALTKSNSQSKLFGFLGGPSGILENKAIELTPQYIDTYRNTGGFDMIGSGRTKIETEEQFETSLHTLKERDIRSLVIIGGDDSNTNAALLAEYVLKKGEEMTIIGVPKTIDGDLRGEHVDVSFGFDSATKVYSELIGNIARDTNSAKKYWHFIKLMGRSASHICLECALKTHPNIAIISEEVEDTQKTLNQIVEDIVDVIVRRSENGENFGITLIPEGLIEFIPEVGKLITELNKLLAEHELHFNSLKTFEDQSEWVNKNLSRDSSYVFSSLPYPIQRQLLIDRDPHGNVQVSRIETEKLLLDLVSDRLGELKNEGKYRGKFSSQTHFLGYEGRSGFPTNFDADYAYSLGYNAFLLIAEGLTGYMTAIKNLVKPVEDWIPGGVPITMMMNLEERKGKLKPVIKKAMVDLKGKAFKTFVRHRNEWAVKTSYVYPGSTQYFGPAELCEVRPESLLLESKD